MAEASIECGFCCHKLATMTDPVELPCSHVHCLGCIKGFYEKKEVMRCPDHNCGKVVKVPLESLPPYDLDSKKCDSCLKQKKGRKAAFFYCGDCKNYFCQAHQQSHDELLVGHQMTPVSNLDVESKQEEEDKCDIHQEQTLCIGCRTCLEPFCVKCISGLSACKDGNPHKLMSLEEVVSELLTDEITKDMTEREVQLEGLFKQTSKAVGKHDEETEEGLQKVRETKKEHLREVKEKYEQLEREWIERRGKQKEELTDFLDDEVLRKWNKIREGKEALESKIKQARKVEVLKGLKELMTLQSQSLSEELPQLVSNGSIALALKGESRDTELSLTPSADLVIALDKPNLTLPKQMSHSLTKKLPVNPCSLYSQDGCLYVGMDHSKIARVDRFYNVDESFISCPGQVWSITVYKDRVYTLIDSSRASVCVYDMSGKRLAQWSVSCRPSRCNLLAVVSDKLVVADKSEKRLSVFSLTGQLLRQVPCSLIGGPHVFMCAVFGDSIIISNDSTFKVSRFNITTGSVEWSVSMHSPPNVCCYGSKYVLVGRSNSKSVQIIDIVSGRLVSEITSEVMTGERVYGLQMSGSQLVVADREYKQIQLFDLSS